MCIVFEAAWAQVTDGRSYLVNPWGIMHSLLHRRNALESESGWPQANDCFAAFETAQRLVELTYAFINIEPAYSSPLLKVLFHEEVTDS